VFSPAAIERDIALFGGHCGQYVFVSSASAYEKPLRTLPITESVPLHNPYWDYSRAKAEVEARLRAQNKLLYTIVRPSHTYRTKMPMPLGGEVSRMLRGKPVVIHGDGESLWTITHAEDFARPFVRLLGAAHVLGEAYHITNDRQWSWNEIVEASASALGVGEIDVVHVATDTLIAYRPEWEGPLLGDKSASVIFDNSKIKAAVGDFDCPIGPWEGMRMVAERYPPRAEEFDAALDHVYDRIVAAARRERHFASDRAHSNP
jgi:nucleoside-diphosphate-sugar epimerase